MILGIAWNTFMYFIGIVGLAMVLVAFILQMIDTIREKYCRADTKSIVMFIVASLFLFAYAYWQWAPIYMALNLGASVVNIVNLYYCF